nr:hypothetical protein [Mucilaginibacter sp. SP1R1]
MFTLQLFTAIDALIFSLIACKKRSADIIKYLRSF